MLAQGRKHLVLGLLVAAAVSACSNDAVGPRDRPTFDAAAVQANLDALNAIFETQGWASFTSLSSRFGLPGVAGGAVTQARSVELLAARPAGPEARGEAARLARELLAAVGEPPRASAVPVISDGARGTTFVYDPQLGQYVPDPARSGAPENGVRFILYAVNPVTGELIVDREIGHADLTDDGERVGGITLRLEVVSEGETFLDYSVRVEGDESGGTITVAGFVRDRENRLDFDIHASGTSEGGEETFDLVVHLEIAAQDFQVDASISGVSSETSASHQVELLVRYGDQSIRIEVMEAEGSLEASFFLNGELFATATGDPADPEILGADGEPLSPAETEVLGQLVQLVDGLFELFYYLLEPAGAIVELGVAL